MRSLNFILALICLASANAHAQTERKDPAMITANLHCMQGSYGGGEYGPLELAYDDGKGLQTFVGTWDNTKSYVSISSESVQFTIEDLKQEHVNLAETHLPGLRSCDFAEQAFAQSAEPERWRTQQDHRD